MLPSQIRANWPFHSEDVRNRFSRWPPWPLSWISDWKEFIYLFIYLFIFFFLFLIYKSPLCFLSSFKSIGFLIQEKDQYSARCSSSLCLKPYQVSSALGSQGGPLCQWPCYHHWIAWGMCQEALDLERSNGEERTESKCRKDKDHDLQYGTGPPAEFRWVSMRRLSHWCGQQQHLLQWLQALGAQEMQWAQALEKGPWLQMYTVPGNCMPLGWQTTEGSPGRTWQAWGGSFLLLPRRHALSSRWLWTLNHNTCENRLEEVQGSATSSLFTPPLFQNTWPCVQLLCVERNAPCQRELAIDKAEPPASTAKWQGNDQTDLQHQAARHCHHQVQWATCAAWHWGSGPHSEGEKTPMVWTCGMLQWCSQDSLWHTGWRKAWAWEAQNDMEAADREGLQRVEALGYQPSW